MKHTPGPWRVYQEKPHYYSVGTDYANDRGSDQNIVRDVRKESNARVMAAAPELLEGAEQIIESIYDSFGECCVCEIDGQGNHAPNCPVTKLKAAIRKAKGA